MKNDVTEMSSSYRVEASSIGKAGGLFKAPSFEEAAFKAAKRQLNSAENKKESVEFRMVELGTQKRVTFKAEQSAKKDHGLQVKKTKQTSSSSVTGGDKRGNRSVSSPRKTSKTTSVSAQRRRTRRGGGENNDQHDYSDDQNSENFYSLLPRSVRNQKQSIIDTLEDDSDAQTHYQFRVAVSVHEQGYMGGQQPQRYLPVVFLCVDEQREHVFLNIREEDFDDPEKHHTFTVELDDWVVTGEGMSDIDQGYEIEIIKTYNFKAWKKQDDNSSEARVRGDMTDTHSIVKADSCEDLESFLKSYRKNRRSSVFMVQ